jgi:2-dehydropantoate 2-reductase
MVCFQNGLCEERIAPIAGHERVIGGIVAWGATMVEPGVYDRTSAGGFVLGRFDGTADPRVDELARILEAVGPTTTTANLAGARWSKLAINCAISALGTIAGDRLGVLMRHRFIRRLALEIMTEAVEVARAAGVRLEKVSGTLDLDWIALTPAERVSAGSPGLFAKHTLLLAVGARYRRLRSSMLAAIERGRPPAVDFLNGEVLARGSACGIATPINAAVRDEVMKIAAGKARPSLDLLRALFDRTRVILGAPPLAVSPTLPDDGVAPAPYGGVAPVPDESGLPGAKTIFEAPMSESIGSAAVPIDVPPAPADGGSPPERLP